MKIFFLISLIFFSSNFAKATCEDDRAISFQNAKNSCDAIAGCDTNVPPNCTVSSTSFVPYRDLYSTGVGGLCHYTNHLASGQSFSYTIGLGPIADCGLGLNSQPQQNVISIKSPEKICGSIVEVENQVLLEEVELVGTHINLVYNSAHVKGRTGDFSFFINLSGSTPRDSITSFDVVTNKNGSVVDSDSFSNIANQVYSYSWNGLDGSGNETIGPQKFVVDVTENISTTATPIQYEVTLGHFNAKKIGLGGWAPSVYHFYHADSKLLYNATGSAVKVPAKIWNTTGHYLPSEDGSLVYYFDSSGRQIYTKSGLTGTTLYTFNYDSQGRLSSIVEPFSRTTLFNRNTSGDLTSITSPKGHITLVSLDTNGYIASVTNPNSEVYSMTYYSTSGLLYTFTKPGAQVSTFTYDSNGNLTQDAHSGGYFFDLIKNISSNHIDYSQETPMGRENKYQGVSSEQYVNRTNLYSNGLQDTYVNTISSGGSSETSSRLGYTLIVNKQDDTRFGSVVQFPTGTNVYYGSVGYTVANTQNVTLTDPNDPFSIDTYSINSTKGNLDVTTDYDPSTKKFSTYTALGKTSETEIDNYERIISQKRGNLYPVEFTYTNENLTKIEQNTRETTLAYNSTTGFLSTITNPLSQTTAFTYDSAGRVASKILPDLRTIAYSYDANGNISGITPPGRTIHSFGLNASELPSSYEPPTLSGVSVVNTTYTYNNDKQLTEINKPNGDSIEYTYNTATGVLESVTTPAGNHTFWMNSTNGLPATILSPSGLYTSISYAGTIPTQFNVYDGIYSFNNGYTKTLSSNGTVGDDTVSTSIEYDQIYYTYDDDEFLTGAGDLTLTYSTPSALLTATSIGTSSNIVTDEYTYNSYGEVTNYKAKYGTTVIYDLDLTRDGMGRISGKTQSMNSTTDTYAYSFDTSGRLTQTNKNSVTVATYGYDDNSNRNSGTIGSQTTSATYDAQDRMTAYNVLTFTYNANGDLTGKTNTLLSTTISYTYDVFGNLISVTLPNTDVITYEIDGLNRRIGKSYNGVLQKRWIYMDQTRIAAEVDALGNITKRFVYGSKGNIPDYMIMGSDNYRIISDHLGSPRLVVKVSDGSITGRMDHDEFGRVTTDTNPGLLPFGFAGGLYDQDTGLLRFGARDYDAETGRWTSKDPILFAGGDSNLFGYVTQDPVNWIDPTGEVLFAPIIGGALVGAGIDLGLQLINNGGDIQNVNWSSVGTSAAIGGAFGGFGRIFGPFSPRGLPPNLSKYRQYFRFDPPHHGKWWHFDGTIGKHLDKFFKLSPSLLIKGDGKKGGGIQCVAP